MTSAESQQPDNVMTRPELRIFFADWFCGCGNPEDAAHSLLRLLEMHPMYERYEEFKLWQPDMGVRYLLLYTLDSYDLTEHGGNVGGAWLTPKGEALKAGLEREFEDGGFLPLFDGTYCIHGVTHEEDPEHDCMSAGEPVPWTENRKLTSK